MVGVNFATSYLRPDGRQDADTPVDLVIEHLERILKGEDGVGFGSDFDGAKVPAGVGNGEARSVCDSSPPACSTYVDCPRLPRGHDPPAHLPADGRRSVIILRSTTRTTFSEAIVTSRPSVHSAPPHSNAKPPTKGDTAIATSSGKARRPISPG